MTSFPRDGLSIYFWVEAMCLNLALLYLPCLLSTSISTLRMQFHIYLILQKQKNTVAQTGLQFQTTLQSLL